MVASSDMVQQSAEDVDLPAYQSVPASNYTFEPSSTRTSEKQKMEVVCLESLWKQRALQQGWSLQAASKLKYSLAPSTINNYNMYIEKVKTVCDKNGNMFPPDNSAILADCLINIVSESDRPASMINCTLAALAHVYRILGKNDFTNDIFIKQLVLGIIKSSTKNHRNKSNVMPIEKFTVYFNNLDNNTIDVKMLRLKCIALLALVTMLRPSDIAPKALWVDSEGKEHSYVFKRDQITFNNDGSMSVVIHGNKNDSDRSGFIIDVSPSNEPNICPVQTMKCYLNRTRQFRKSNGPVFISLKSPYGALSSQAITNILNDSIEIVGLPRHVFSAKCFRPTGATKAVSEGFDPNIVLKVGRWKTPSVFFEHYVHSRVPSDFTDKILSVTKL